MSLNDTLLVCPYELRKVIETWLQEGSVWMKLELMVFERQSNIVTAVTICRTSPTLST